MYKLREIQRQDMKEVNSWRNNEDIISTLGAPFRFINQEVDEKWFEQYMLQRNNTVRCAITTKENDKILGIVSLVEIDFINRSAQFHIMVGEDGQNKGAGTFAVKAMIEHGFKNYGQHRIELHVLADNKRAQHVYEKCGFVQEGTRRQAAFKGGQFKDVVIYSIINNREDFKYMRGGVYNACLAALYSTTEKKHAMTVCDDAFARSVLSRDDFKSLFEKIDNSACFCVGHRDDVIGYVAMYANDLQTQVAYITLIGVHREWQNLGVGASLMEWCISTAQNRGMKSIRLEVARDNVGAQRFYKKHGFIVVGNNAGDSFYMEKDISMKSNIHVHIYGGG